MSKCQPQGQSSAGEAGGRFYEGCRMQTLVVGTRYKVLVVGTSKAFRVSPAARCATGNRDAGDDAEVLHVSQEARLEKSHL